MFRHFSGYLRTLLYDAGFSQCDALTASFLRLGRCEGEKREAVLRETYCTSIAEVTDCGVPITLVYDLAVLAMESQAVEGPFHSGISGMISSRPSDRP